MYNIFGQRVPNYSDLVIEKVNFNLINISLQVRFIVVISMKGISIGP